MNYKSAARDDPMGLAIVGDRLEMQKVDVWAGWPAESEGRIETGEIDSMGGKGGKEKEMASAMFVVETDISLEIVFLCHPFVRCLQDAMVAMATGICAMIARLPTQS